MKKSIENYFSESDTMPKMESITTKRYAEFKNDAIGVEFDTDTSLTPKQFTEKWGKIYNLKRSNNESFLIGLEDNGNVQVTTIKQIKITENGAWYHVIMKDSYSKRIINRDIKIIKNGNSFLIDEVLEKD